MLARAERMAEPVFGADAALPADPFQVQQVVNENGAPLQQVERVAAEATSQGGDHAFSAVLRDCDVGCDLVIPIEDAWSIGRGDADVLADVSEGGAAGGRAWAFGEEPGQD